MRIEDLQPTDLAAARASPLLSHLSENALEEVLVGASISNYARGAFVFHATDPAKYFYIVVEGWVQLTRVEATGRSHVIAVFSRGESMAEAIAFAGGKYPASGQAMTDCRLVAIRGDAFLDAMQTDRSILGNGLAAIYRHLHYLVEEVENLKSRTIRQRAARFLTRLSHATEGPARIQLPFEKALLAAKIGTSPENLSRTLAAMTDIGLTVERDAVWVDDMATLIDEAGFNNDPG